MLDKRHDYVARESTYDAREKSEKSRLQRNQCTVVLGCQKFACEFFSDFYNSLGQYKCFSVVAGVLTS